MELWETVLCGVGLAADAVAVSAVKGMENRRSPFRSAVLCGLWFGAFQALMTALGALLGDRFRTVILQIDHWLSFAVLCFIGVRMILDAFSPDTRSDGSLAAVPMAASAFATSVDAAAVGVSLACVDAFSLSSAAVIGGVTLLLCAASSFAARLIPIRSPRAVSAAGGLILIGIGARILWEHLG